MPMRLSRQRNGIAARRAILSKIPPRLYPRIGSDIRIFFKSLNSNRVWNMTESDSWTNDQTESKFSFVLQWRHCNWTTPQNWRWPWTWIQAQVCENVKNLLKLIATVRYSRLIDEINEDQLDDQMDDEGSGSDSENSEVQGSPDSLLGESTSLKLFLSGLTGSVG